MPSSAWRSTLFPYTTLFRSDRKSTRLNSSHSQISYAVFCLKKKTINPKDDGVPHPTIWRSAGCETVGTVNIETRAEDRAEHMKRAPHSDTSKRHACLYSSAE